MWRMELKESFVKALPFQQGLKEHWQVHIVVSISWRFPRWLSGKESACQCRRWEFDPWVGKISWRRKWQQPTPAFLPGKSHGQRSLLGCSPWCHKRVGHDLATKQQQQGKGCCRNGWWSVICFQSQHDIKCLHCFLPKPNLLEKPKTDLPRF